MASGSGTYWLAIIGTGVTLGTLYGLRAIDAAVFRRKQKVRRRLEVHISDAAKLESLLKFIRRIDPAAEQLDYRRSGDHGGVLVVSCHEDEVVKKSEMLASHRIVTKVEELSPLLWPQHAEPTAEASPPVGLIIDGNRSRSHRAPRSRAVVQRGAMVRTRSLLRYRSRDRCPCRPYALPTHDSK